MRERLSADLIALLSQTYETNSLLTEDEYSWALEALQWINWHAGKVGGRNLADGLFLTESSPERAQTWSELSS